MFPGTKIQSL